MPLDFDGTDDNVFLPADMLSVDGISAFTFMTWVYLESYHSGAVDSDMINFSINNSGTPTNSSRANMFLYRVTGQPGLSAKAPDTGSAQAAIGDTGIPLNTWTHVGGTIDIAADSAVVYMNGVSQTLDGSFTFSWTATALDTGPSTSNSLGASDMRTTEFINGRLADMRFYNRVLSAAEFEAVYSCNGHDNVVYGLVNRWALDENADGVTASISGENKDWGNAQAHGTPTNGPIYRDGPIAIRQRYR